jgi:hypothetical protein
MEYSEGTTVTHRDGAASIAALSINAGIDVTGAGVNKRNAIDCNRKFRVQRKPG